MTVFDSIYKVVKNFIDKTTNNNVTQISVNQFELDQIKQKIQLKNSNIDISPSVNIFLLSKFFDISQTKKDLIKEIDENIKESYIAQQIANKIIEDSLTPLVDKNFFTITIKDKEGNIDNTLTQIVSEFIENFDIKKILLDISFDLLFYGEYYLRLNTIDKEGIINISDDVDISTIIPVYRDSTISYFLKYEYEEKKIINVSPNNFVYFHLPNNRIRVKTHALDDKILYVRMGRSLFYPVFGLIKELMFFEKLYPAAMIQKLNSPKLVGVTVPPNTPPNEALEISRIYQKMLDRSMAKHNNYNSIDELLKEIQNTSKIKAIPVWNDSKGELRPQDVGENIELDDIQNKIQDLRELIVRILGLPISIIGAEAELKVDLIKQNSAYVKKLKSLQQAIEYGLKHLIYVHLYNMGFNYINQKNIEVAFVNTVDYDTLSRLEVADVMVSMFDNIDNFLDTMSNKDNVDINIKEYIELVNGTLNNILGRNLIKYKEENSEEY